MKKLWDLIIENPWETLLFIVIFTTAFGFFYYCFTPKTFNGYYLRHGGMFADNNTYSVCINWDNAPDHTVYATYDGHEALEVYEKLLQLEVKDEDNI